MKAKTLTLLLGTLVFSTACGAQRTCGAGTSEAGDGTCVLDPGQACGAGTAFVNGACVASGAPVSVTCGAGTTEVNGACVAAITACGAGTTNVGGACVAAIQSCGSGTMMNGSQCVTAGLSCGAGTAQVGSECRVNLSAVCSTDTTGAGGTTCVGRVMCGAGTQRQGDACVANFSNICAAGTVLRNGRCEVPGQVASLQTFSAASNLKVSYHHEVDSSATAYASHTIMITDLSQGSADAWTTSWIDPVGQGAALHLGVRTDRLLGCSSPSLPCDSVTVPISGSAATGGVCNAALQPWQRPSSGTYANFYGWNLMTPSLAACATGGSVRIERLNVNGVDSVRITVNAQFNDNSTWMDRVFVTPFR